MVPWYECTWWQEINEDGVMCWVFFRLFFSSFFFLLHFVSLSLFSPFIAPSHCLLTFLLFFSLYLFKYTPGCAICPEYVMLDDTPGDRSWLFCMKTCGVGDLKCQPLSRENRAALFLISLFLEDTVSLYWLCEGIVKQFMTHSFIFLSLSFPPSLPLPLANFAVHFPGHGTWCLPYPKISTQLLLLPSCWLFFHLCLLHLHRVVHWFLAQQSVPFKSRD